MNDVRHLIRVLHVASALDLGGTAKTMQLFVQHLDRRRFLPAVWSPGQGPRGRLLRDSGVPLFIGKDLAACARQFRPHIVHVHRAGWPEPELLRPLRAAFRPGPEHPCRRLPRIVETNVFGRYDPSPSGRLIDVTLLVSHFCAERLRVAEGRVIEAPRHEVLYNPVDVETYAVLTPDPEQRDYSRPVFGRLSRADPGKWSMLTLEALPLVRSRVPEFTFLVIGGIPEAGEFVRAHGLERHVHFLPPALTDEELAGFFNRLSFFAHANNTGESFGMVIAEAMAAGLPVVTHPCRDWRDNAQVELVRNGVTGFVADGPQAYADAVVRLLSDPALCRAAGAAARADARARFDVHALTRRLEAIYDETLSRIYVETGCAAVTLQAAIDG
ncbi:MAG: glycosyltransferase family 4 protein [Desulfovibrio sp.]|nr:glycosyltransferase family 4 protein [Desulfovibrio sp.]